jgi:hypothetical protein
LIEFFHAVRFEHPRVFWTGIVSATIAASMYGFMSIPPGPVAKATGVTQLQRRAASLYYAGFWFARVEINGQSAAPILSTNYGNVVGLDRRGRLIVSVPNGDRFGRVEVSLADVRLTDLRGAATLIKGVRDLDAKFEEYPGNQYVVWLNQIPLNVQLIEAGLAEPDPNPPTNIVDKAFATYYWRNFYGS